VGIGGGGDVVGALATAELFRAHGSAAVLGGTTWERRPIDPHPGPRRLDELEGAERLNDAIALARAETTGPGGVRFAEARMAELLDEPVVLVDVTVGPRTVADGLADAARRLDCDLVALIDVGGDALAHGDEPGLGSPLCDAVFVAGAPRLAEELPVVLGIFGAGCDGELTPDEVLERVAEVAAAGGLLGAWGLTPEAMGPVQAAVDAIPTEASAMALQCARGAYGPAPIRDGRRTVNRTPVGAVTFYLDPVRALESAARLARAVIDADSLDEANARLHELGLQTELDWERRAVEA
jgi:hypothetical protein